MTRHLVLTADRCPVCTGTHPHHGDWPTCPHHGHLLYQLTVDDTGWTYTCPAWKCKHTHTQKEKATMTAASEAATAALAIRQGQDAWTPKQLAALRQIGAEDAPDGDLEVFLHYCQATGLDPFAKQIRLRKDRQRVKDANGHEQWENRWSIETEIDGYRVIAHRAAKRDGVELSYGPPVWFDAAGGEHKIWLGEDPPSGAARTVYKNSKPFPAVVRLKSFAKYTKEGQLQAMWAVMPDHLLGKCVEAQALRMAFPHDFEGISLSDETAPPAPAAAVQEQPKPIPAPRPKPAPRRPRTNTDALRDAIGNEFGRLGLADRSERSVYVYNLANKQVGDDLTDADLRFIHDALVACGDIGELQDLCNPEVVEEEQETPA